MKGEVDRTPVEPAGVGVEVDHVKLEGAAVIATPHVHTHWGEG